MNEWRVGGLTLESPLIIGAGVCKEPHSVLQYQNPHLPLGATVAGSFTPEPREPNAPAPLSAWIDYGYNPFGLNSYGMPNVGFAQADHQFREMLVKLGTRPLILSLAGFKPEDYRNGVSFFNEAPYAAAFELNFGCPNAHDKKTVPMTYDLESLEATLKLIAECGVRKPLWLKFSPLVLESERAWLGSHSLIVDRVITVPSTYAEQLCELVSTYRTRAHIKAVVVSNTVGNCKFLGKDGRPVTGPNQGLAGLSGKFLKPIASRMAREMLKLLPTTIDVIRSGGIFTGDDVVEALGDMCAGVELTSLPYWHSGPKAIPSLLEGSERLCQLLTTHS